MSVICGQPALPINSELKTVPVFANGCEVGYVYEDKHARYCHIMNVLPTHRNLPGDAQANELFEILVRLLKDHAFTFDDTIRTWFHLDHILDWYPAFNAVRTAFFTKHGLFERLIPASTGVGISNLAGAALSGGLWAVHPKLDTPCIQTVPSPLQCTALDYQSSFSRAVELSFPKHRSLLVSGTASIAMNGQTAHLDDPASQIDLTMRVMTALLRSRGMDWSDVTRTVAYFQNDQDRPLLDAYVCEHSLPKFPVAMVSATICRADLLFEIEVDAIHST